MKLHPKQGRIDGHFQAQSVRSFQAHPSTKVLRCEIVERSRISSWRCRRIPELWKANSAETKSDVGWGDWLRDWSDPAGCGWSLIVSGKVVEKEVGLSEEFRSGEARCASGHRRVRWRWCERRETSTLHPVKSFIFDRTPGNVQEALVEDLACHLVGELLCGVRVDLVSVMGHDMRLKSGLAPESEGRAVRMQPGESLCRELTMSILLDSEIQVEHDARTHVGYEYRRR